MLGYCPSRAPLNDPETEQEDIRFWKEWWQTHHVEIAETVPLPNVSAPARYNVPENTGWQPVELPMEIRFMSLLRMAASQSDHYHDGGGPIVEKFLNDMAIGMGGMAAPPKETLYDLGIAGASWVLLQAPHASSAFPLSQLKAVDQNESTDEVIRAGTAGWPTALSLVYARLPKARSASTAIASTARTGLYRPSDD